MATLKQNSLKLRDYKGKWKIPYPVISFKGRTFDTQKRIRVHRNLHKKTFSISQGGQVRAHADCMMLTHCEFVVSKAGHKRSLKIGQRTVHAFVEGFLAHSAYGATPLEPEGSKFRGARYNRKTGFFETVDFMPAGRLKSADAVLLHPKGMQTIMFDYHR